MRHAIAWSAVGDAAPPVEYVAHVGRWALSAERVDSAMSPRAWRWGVDRGYRHAGGACRTALGAQRCAVREARRLGMPA